MRRLAQKGSNVRDINRNLCEIVFFFRNGPQRFIDEGGTYIYACPVR